MSLQDDAQNIRATLSVIFREQGENAVSRLLDEARVEIEYLDHDNWNGGIDYYGLVLWITPQRFAAVEKDIESIQKKIATKFGPLNLERGSEQLSNVQIAVDRVASATATRMPFPSSTDVDRIWTPGRLRLFLSHVSRVKASAVNLKTSLASLGIDAFVAHEDIEPTRAWELEIELALRSAHALCAFVTSDLLGSKWCGQEIGVALGRSIPVLPVRFGADPYGLMGKLQAIPRADTADTMATRIFVVLMKTDSCRTLLVEGLVATVESADSSAVSLKAMEKIEDAQKYLSREQVQRLVGAVRSNFHLRDRSDVNERVKEIAKPWGIPTIKEEADDIPF